MTLNAMFFVQVLAWYRVGQVGADFYLAKIAPLKISSNTAASEYK
jgi:hypothetical protein